MTTLQAEKREIFGKKLKIARALGKLPVVLYGPKHASTHYFVEAKEFLLAWRAAGESTVVNFVSPEGTTEVLIHEVAMDPVRDFPIHADFYVIEAGKLLRVTVPLEYVGTAPAVKNLSGVLVKVLHEVEIEAMPKHLVHKLAVEVSHLATFEDRLRVGDISIPEGVTVVSPGLEEIVALVAPPKEEKEEEAAPADLSKIEVEKKGKKEEEGEVPPVTSSNEK